MKKLITTFVIILIGAIGFSQAPQKFTYQSIVRSADGLVLRSSDIGLQISILKNSALGQAVYTETHTARSNANGLVTVVIGDGTTGDNISDIDWSTGQYYIKVEVDPSGGIGYSIEQTAQLLSVPYALYAGNSSSSSVDLDKDVEGILPVVKGGTGSSTAPMIAVVTAPDASTARAILGIGDMKGSKVELKSVTDNYLSIQDKADGSGDQELTAGTVPITLGGTGSTTAPMVGVITAADAAAARTVLEIDKSGTDNSTAVTLATVNDNYLTLSGQEITAGTVPVTLGGTGSTTAPMVGVITAANAPAARTILGLEDAVEKYTIPVSLRYVNQNYLQLNGQEIIATKVPISLGGTGSSTAPMIDVVTAADAAAARKVLGVDAAGDGGKVFLSSVQDNYLSIQNSSDGSGNQTLTASTVPVTLGGTGSTTAPMVAVITAADAAAARTILGLEDAVEKFTIPVSLKNVPNNYLQLNGQEITSGIVPVTLGGTGSSTAPMVAVITAADPAAARTVLEIDKAGTDNSTAVTLANVTDNYLSLSGQELTSGIVPVSLGGTGSSTAPMVGVITASNAINARNVLGLGTISVQNKDAVDIDGGVIDGTPIGSSTASSGSFTTVQTTDNISIGGNSKDLRFYSGSNYVGFRAPSLSADQIWNLPSQDGSADQVLKTDGSGNLTWTTNSGSATIAVDDLTDSKKAGTNFAGSMLIGNETPGTLSDGDPANNNIGVGEIALDALTTGDNNIAVGYDALNALTTASGNTAIGAGAGKQTLAGGENVFVGNSAGDANTSGQQNVIIGSGSDASAADGANQIAIGYGVTGGGNNTVVLGNGDVTAWLPTDNNEVDLGTSTKQLKDLYVDGVAYTDALGFGTTAMTLPTADGSANQVLKTDGSGTLSWTAMSEGASAIDDLTDGKSGGSGFTGSVLLGHETTGTLNDAQYNTAVGLTALDAVTEGDDNTAVGYNALTGATTGSKNVAVGKGAMTAAVTGEGNMAVGYNALNSLTSGGGNVAIGRQVLSKVEGGSKNVGIGRQAGIQIVAGDVGGTSLVSGSQNTYIGAETVPSAANATNETVIGQGATGGGNNSVTLGNTSNESVFISSTVSTKPLVELKNTTNDANSGILKLVKDKGAAGADGDNIGILEFVGDDAAQTQTSFAKIVAEVSEADDTDEAGKLSLFVAESDGTTTALTAGLVLEGEHATDGEIDVTIGSGTASTTAVAGTLSVGGAFTIPASIGSSGQVLKVPASGTILEWGSGGGASAIDDLTDGKSGGTNFTGSMLLGHETTGTLNEAQYNTAVGITAMDALTSGDSNTAVGYNALTSLSSSDFNTAVGYDALSDHNSGNANTAFGYQSLRKDTSGFGNTAIGVEAMEYNDDGYYNTAVGITALYAGQGTHHNVAIGRQSLQTLGNGGASSNNNIGIGYLAGKYMTTGDYNILIGSSTRTFLNEGGVNQIIIGKGARGKSDNMVVLGNNDVTDVYMAYDMGATVHADGVKFYEDTANGTNYVGFQSAATLGGDQVWTLPTADGTNGQVLKTDGSGTLAWTANSGVAGAIDDLTDGKSRGTNFDYSMILGHETTGTLNIATGNTAVGINAMKAITEGDYNTALGYDVFIQLTTGQYNTAIGARAMHEIISGTYNTAIGTFALDNNETASYNTAIGYNALTNATTGYNTAIGYNAGNVISTGSRNTLIGMSTDPSANNGSDQIVIGYGATGQGNNKAVIGSASVTDVYMAQDMGATVHADGVKFYEDTANGTNYVGFNSAATLGGDQVWTLPAADGTNGQVLKTDGSGVLAWVNNSGVAGAIDDLSDGKKGGTNFTDSMILGHTTTGTLSNAAQNTAVGIDAMKSITGGDDNTAVGFEALQNNTTTSRTTAVGSKALWNSSGNDNTAVGYQASYANSSGQFNVAIGSEALYSNLTSSQNVAIGRRALYSMTSTGNDNTAIGYYAGADGNSNTAITGGKKNVLIGHQSGVDNANAENRIVIGQGARGLADNMVVLGNSDVTDVYMAQDMGATVHADGVKFYEDTANGTNYVGFNSAATLGGDQVWTLPTADGSANQVLKTDGSGVLAWVNNSGVAGAIDDLSDGKSGGTDFTGSMILGHETTGTLDAAQYNTAVGINAMDAITTGDRNTAIGYNALTSNTSGNENTALGMWALNTNTTGIENTALGSRTLYSNDSGGYNTALGYYALYYNTTGSGNTALGSRTLIKNTTGTVNTAMGTRALQENISGTENTATGYYALRLNTTGDYNTASGSRSLYSNTTGDQNTALGYRSLYTNDKSDYNVALGYGALESHTGGASGNTYNTAVGYKALNASSVGGNNVALGYQALYSNVSGHRNIAIGHDALDDADAEHDNLAIGYYALGAAINGAEYNVAIGNKALEDNISGDDHVAIGYEALKQNTTGYRGVAIGRGALDANTEGHNNVGVGYLALSSNLTSGDNTAIGTEALSISTGASNTAIGYKAGDANMSGQQNVVIGATADASAGNAINQIVIGYGATGTGNNEIALGNTSISAIKAQVTSITAYSDRRIKREINDSKLGLDFIMKLRPVTYKMKNPADYPDEILEDRFRMDVTSGPNNEATDFRPADDQTIYDGLIAQEVKEAIDEAGVNWSGWSENESDGKQGVQYGALTIPLIKAVQEQQETINSLKKENQELSDRLKAIEKALLR